MLNFGPGANPDENLGWADMGQDGDVFLSSTSNEIGTIDVVAGGVFFSGPYSGGGWSDGRRPPRPRRRRLVIRRRSCHTPAGTWGPGHPPAAG